MREMRSVRHKPSVALWSTRVPSGQSRSSGWPVVTESLLRATPLRFAIADLGWPWRLGYVHRGRRGRTGASASQAEQRFELPYVHLVRDADQRAHQHLAASEYEEPRAKGLPTRVEEADAPREEPDGEQQVVQDMRPLLALVEYDFPMVEVDLKGVVAVLDVDDVGHQGSPFHPRGVRKDTLRPWCG